MLHEKAQVADPTLVSPGDLMVVPPRAIHTFENASKTEEAELYMTATPGHYIDCESCPKTMAAYVGRLKLSQTSECWLRERRTTRHWTRRTKCISWRSLVPSRRTFHLSRRPSLPESQYINARHTLSLDMHMR